MKRTIIENANEIAMNAYDAAMSEYEKTPYSYLEIRRLRSCSATTIETENYIFLRSYATIVAVIDKRTGILYDVLRNVYGYTATSAQHIAKFAHDEGAGEIVRFTR